MGLRNYRDYKVWQRAMDLCEAVYRESAAFPKEEVFGLRAQLRRAVVSIPSNIAEGQGRGNDKEFNHFLRIAYASLREVETQLEIAQGLNFLVDKAVQDLLEVSSEVGRLINGLRRSI